MKQNILSILFLIISILSLVNSDTAKGVIECVYEVTDIGEYTKILGDEFIPNSDITMTINDEKKPFLKIIFSLLEIFIMLSFY